MSPVHKYSLEDKMKAIEKSFTINNEQLTNMINIIHSEMVTGLDSGTKSSLGMLPTYVSALPTGNERGCFLALDLGGTNFRILLVKIEDMDNSKIPKIEMISEQFMIPEEFKVGQGRDFFDHIAKCMEEFCQINGLGDELLPVGFTFSFPLKQQGLNSAILLRWNKGFDLKGVKGKDVVKMLHEAIRRRGGPNCKVVAIVNDTVGTMMACALDQCSCNVGLIIGTGMNVCYMERCCNIRSITSSAKQMCVNMEMGGLGKNGVIDAFLNEYDLELDKNSTNPKDQTFEKMLSGKYLGEIVRIILCDLTKNAGLFNGVGSKKLFVKNSFQTAFVSEIDSAWTSEKNSINLVKNVLNFLDLDVNEDDCDVVRRICHFVSMRAANLCAAAVAAIAKKIKANFPQKDSMKITVGVDGTMFRKHINFKKHMISKVDELCKKQDVSVDFILSSDGSGKGAAVIAAAMCHVISR